MYKEIQRYYYDANLFREGTENLKAKDYYKKGDTVFLRLDSIRRITTNSISDETLSLYDLVISDDFHENITVEKDEALAIKKTLLGGKNSGLENEIHTLTLAIRDLWNLLRARMR